MSEYIGYNDDDEFYVAETKMKDVAINMQQIDIS